MATNSSPSIKLFLCYTREDEELRQNLEKQLRVLRRQGLIDVWHDRQIHPGAEWKGEIDKHLNSAQIILLLISPDFMDSDYCYGIEMRHAMERHQRGEAHVIPIILRQTLWQGAPFGTLQVLPTDATPVISRKWHNQDEAFADIARGIYLVVSKLLSQHPIVSDSLTSTPTTTPSLQTISSQQQRTELIFTKEIPKNGRLRPFLGRDRNWYFSGQQPDESIRRIIHRSSKEFWIAVILLAIGITAVLYISFDLPISLKFFVFLFYSMSVSWSFVALCFLVYGYVHLKDTYILTNKRIISSAFSIISLSFKNNDVLLDSITHVRVSNGDIQISLIDGTFSLKDVKEPEQVRDLLQKLIVN